MSEEEVLEKIILPTCKAAQSQMPYFNLENPAPETALYGTENAVLDSLNLVTFIFALEDRIRLVSGRTVTIGPDDFLTSNGNPFASVRELTLFVQSKINHE